MNVKKLNENNLKRYTLYERRFPMDVIHVDSRSGAATLDGLRAFNDENERKQRRRKKREQKKLALTAAKRGQKIEEEKEE